MPSVADTERLVGAAVAQAHLDTRLLWPIRVRRTAPQGPRRHLPVRPSPVGSAGGTDKRRPPNQIRLALLEHASHHAAIVQACVFLSEFGSGSLVLGELEVAGCFSVSGHFSAQVELAGIAMDNLPGRAVSICSAIFGGILLDRPLHSQRMHSIRAKLLMLPRRLIVL